MEVQKEKSGALRPCPWPFLQQQCEELLRMKIVYFEMDNYFPKLIFRIQTNIHCSKLKTVLYDIH